MRQDKTRAKFSTLVVCIFKSDTLPCYIAKLATLKLKTRPKQYLGSLLHYIVPLCPRVKNKESILVFTKFLANILRSFLVCGGSIAKLIMTFYSRMLKPSEPRSLFLILRCS